MDANELRQRLDTIVIVMMENRSFDHLLGHLSQSAFGGRSDIDGIASLVNPRYANPSQNGTLVSPFLMPDHAFLTDLPHERDLVAVQLAASPVLGGPTMTGFVRAFEIATGTSGLASPPPMGLLLPNDLPATSFLAREYAVCDRWFAPVPTSTQPNRLVAMSGYTLQDTTLAGLLPNQETLFDWLDAHHVRWRVYSAGLSFYSLMPRLWPRLLGNQFRRLSDLSHDFQHDSADQLPNVIIVEPDYEDSPVHLSGHACDNHPPLPVAFGEAFVRQVYEALTASPGRWQRTAMLLTYDEHGGFFDHVAPLPVPSPTPNGAGYAPFASSGVRVPAIVVSPLVARGSAKHANLDHTSILALLAERFGAAGEAYSPAVAERQRHGVASASAVFDSGPPRTDIPPMSPAPITALATLHTWKEPQNAMGRSFVAAMEGLHAAHGAAALQKFPEIAHWLAP
jgi:phospholipase C